MPRTLTSLSLLVLSVLLAACSTTANYDYSRGFNFATIRTVQIVPPQQPASQDTRINSPLVMARFTRAIRSQLAARGYRVVADHADAILHYQVSTRSGIESYDSGVSVGYGHIFPHSVFGIGYTFPDNDVESYDEGVLTVDIVNPADNSLLWRGSNSRRLNDGMTPDKLDETVLKLVDETLANFPPGHSSK